jgi:SAM-dependent methyltransferase
MTTHNALKNQPKENATTRFSDRVADYIKCRPHYPVEILDLLADACGLTPESVIADIGSGTGILSALFLENGNPVIGVEPNREMREAGEAYLAEYNRFTSIDGTAEATRLPSGAMDFVLAGQAFHWFDRDKTRQEFVRILKPTGVVALIWNDRRVDTTPFLRDYESLLQAHAIDYNEINHKNVQDRAVFEPFFGGKFYEATFDNTQRFDLEGLMGRLHSSSYIPARDAAGYPAMAKRAREIFDAHHNNGRVTFEYDTRVYYGEMS